LAEREQEIFAQVVSGNVPNFLRTLCPVEVTNIFEGVTNRATFYVTADYLAVGSDEDYFLAPISPNTAQRLADALGCSLPTRKMVNDIYAAAAVKLTPSPIAPSPAMTTVPVFSNHNATVLAQRTAGLNAHPLGALVAGHKKDVVISAKLQEAPGKVAIYGWHQTNGTPIQPLYLGHTADWVDYSQCTRLVQRTLLANGRSRTIAEVLADPALAGLLSDEGVILNPSYPLSNSVPQEDQSPRLLMSAATGQSTSHVVTFQKSGHFGERIALHTLEAGVEVQVNAPPEESFAPSKKVLLIFYALPNGNTTLQTMARW